MSEIKVVPTDEQSGKEPEQKSRKPKPATYLIWPFFTYSYPSKYGIGEVIYVLFFTCFVATSIFKCAVFYGTGASDPSLAGDFYWPWMGFVWVIQFWGNPRYAEASREFWMAVVAGLILLFVGAKMADYFDWIYERRHERKLQEKEVEEGRSDTS